MTSDFWFEAKNINCFKNGYRIFKNLNLNLTNSENVLLLGPNGSGKSTLIELINRNIYPVINKNTFLKIFNKDLINIWELREKISTVNNDVRTRINPKIRVIDLIISGLHGKYCKITNESQENILLAKNLLKKMSLTNLSQKYFSYLSEGEKQICLIARALVKNPEILILDEPIANLDLRSKFYVIDQINKISKLKTKIICITHDVSMITTIYNRIIMIKDGTIIADGNQKEVLNRKNINNLFDVDIDIVKYKGNWHIYRKNLNNNYY